MELIDEMPFENGPKLFQRQFFSDDRGSFEMLFQETVFRGHFHDFPHLKQINGIRARRGALRGFHASEIGSNHWKVVTCVKGKVIDAMMDLRRESTSFGKVRFAEIDEKSGLSLVIPPGFGHAVQSLTEDSLTIYGTNIEYENNEEFEINPIVGEWSGNWIQPTIVSERDRIAPVLSEIY